jgi:hypothetical protein
MSQKDWRRLEAMDIQSSIVSWFAPLLIVEVGVSRLRLPDTPFLNPKVLNWCGLSEAVSGRRSRQTQLHKLQILTPT